MAQPLDPFAVLELPRRLCLDAQALEASVRRLVIAQHPDRFHLQGAQAVADAQARTSQINDAARILRSFDKRIAYMLDMAGESADERFTPPAALLQQVFDLNEAIDAMQEAQADGDADAVAQAAEDLRDASAAVRAMRADVSARLEQGAQAWDAAQAASEDSGAPPAALAQARTALRAALGHARYLDNLLGRLQPLPNP